MTRTRRSSTLTAVVVSCMAVAACHKKPAPAAAPAPAARTDSDSARMAQELAARQAADAAARRRADSLDAASRATTSVTGGAAALRSTLTAPVHFEYDQSDIRSEERAILDAKIPILQANPRVTIRIAGHTDERGSDEYNLALGERRAAAVKAYLVQHGISAVRIETVSYGEERPVAQGSDESAWAQNRRAEFEITAGAPTARQP